MTFRYLAVLLLAVACAPKGDSNSSNVEVVSRLEQPGITLRRDGGEIYSVYVEEADWSREQSQAVCELKTVTVIEFYNTKLASGAIKALADCSILRTVRFSGKTPTGGSELLSLKDLKPLKIIGFLGSSYGDSIMGYVGQLAQLEEVYVQADERNGSLTDSGIAAFASARNSEAPLQLFLQGHPRITDSAFDHFGKIKGLTYIDFGEVAGVTREGIDAFAARMKASGQTVRIAYDSR